MKVKKMPQGKVNFYDDSRDFGFITPDEGGKDIFFHVKELKASGVEFVDKGQPVSYETKEDRGRIAATNIRLLTP
jgi:CspA family cold shock protein